MDDICRFLVNEYLESSRFNGCPVNNDWNKEEILTLIGEGKIEVVGPKMFPNPHIKPFSGIAIERQVKEFEELCDQCCLYPSPSVLKMSVSPSDYEGRPFSLRLALGEGQLDGVYFDLSVLEQYRNDPRYYYWADDINGKICISDEFYDSDKMDEKDKVLLDTFGFGFNDEFERCVVSLLWYIAGLSNEHQQMWAAKELPSGSFKMHPDYYRNNIIGDWGERLPLCEAFIMELGVINEMSRSIKGVNFFRKDYGSERPKEFAFLIRPTLSAYNSFVLLLDQMMSDNINKKFFEDEIDEEYDHEREDGKVEVRRKGTIVMLEEWVDGKFNTDDDAPLKKMKAAFRKVRKQRQKPAHSHQEDVFDQKYIKDQRGLLLDAYGAVRTLRQILANHPRVRIDPPNINEQLWKGEIWQM